MEGHKLSRVWLLDELRGLAILLMVFYHAMYDLVYIFRLPIPIFQYPWMEWLRYFIVTSFMVISGIVCHFSRSNRRRGFLCFGLAMGLTLVTALVMPSQFIAFGILHFMGISMLLYSLIQRGTDPVPPLLGIGLSLLLFSFTWNVGRRLLGWQGLFTIPLPPWLYQTNWLMPLGFHSPWFSSADYYPLLPWFFLFLTGTFLGVYFKEGRAPRWMYRPHCRPLAAVGRHSILIYLLHQPILYGGLWVLFQLV